MDYCCITHGFVFTPLLRFIYNVSATSVGVGDSTTRRASAPIFRDGQPVPYNYNTHVCLPPVGYGIYDVPYASLVQREVPSSARRRDCKQRTYLRDVEVAVPYDFKTHVCLPPVGYGIYDVPFVVNIINVSATYMPPLCKGR